MSDETPAVYWAAADAATCLAEAVKRRDAWYQYIQTKRLSVWRRALSEYYAGAETKGSLGVEGEAEEFTTVKVNHIHNLGEHLVNAIAGQPPQFQPQAENNDSQSTAETVVASGLLEQAVTQKGLDALSVTTTRTAEVLCEGFGLVEWDATLGKPFAPDPNTGQIVNTGDVRYRYYTPDSACRDIHKENAEEHVWWIIRDQVNRYDLMAEYPQQAEAIKAVPSLLDAETQHPRLKDWGPDMKARQIECDAIWKWTLYHDKSPACPNGRKMCWVGDNVALKDEALPGRELYLYRLAPEDKIGSEEGYSSLLDLIAPQKAVNGCYSMTLSGINNLGHPVIWTKPGDHQVEELKPFTLIKSNEKPEPLNLLNLPPEVMQFAKDLIAQMEIVSGVNAVRRGNIDATGKLSGAAYALIDAKFLEYAAGLQKAYRIWMGKIATATVWCYQDNATAEFVTQIVGKSNRVYTKRFTGSKGVDAPGVLKLSRIQRVNIDMGNPLQRTTSGRLAVADTLLERGLIQTAEQYMAVMQTGRLEPAIEGPAKELDNVKSENELLSDGELPKVWIYDNHALHINEHSGVMASPETRADERIAQAVLQHIAEHLQAWQAAPMDGLAARNIPPPPSLTMMAPSAPGAPGGTKPPAKGETSKTEQAPGPQGAAPQPSMPAMPTNPQTGERAPAPPMA